MRLKIIVHSIIVNLLFVQILFSPLNVFALKNKETHTKLWYKCIGIEDQLSQKNTRDYFYKFSTEMDVVKEVNDFIRTKVEVGCMHRLLMHWGFNLNDPNNHKPFRRDIEKKLNRLQKNGKIIDDEEKEKIRQEIYEYVKGIWIKRNQSIIAETSETFGLSTKSNSLATIIYDIHILADYTDKDLESLAELDFLIEKDLIRHGLQKFCKGTSQEKNGQETIKKILKTLKSGVRTEELINNYQNDINEIFPDKININKLKPDSRKAVKILIILKQDFTKIIGKSFPKHLARKGITITYKQSVNDTVSAFVKKLF